MGGGHSNILYTEFFVVFFYGYLKKINWEMRLLLSSDCGRNIIKF